jgi:hypothetical protein
MLRRTFFKGTLFSIVPYLVSRWLYAQPAVGTESATLRALADVVLPSTLGPARLDEAVGQFTRWVREYRAGAEMSAGYGVTRIQVVPPDPSARHGEQLQALESAARGSGAAFDRLDLVARRQLVQAAIAAAGVEAIPRRPDGQHVATDLMSHFFFVAGDGQDWLYNASIKRETCRGLGSSGARPAPLV